MFDSLFQADQGAGAIAPEAALFSLLLAFVLGQAAGFVYMATHKSMSYSQTFVMSLVVLPVITSLMMMLMSGSLLIAFGFLAVFAVVRFRNVLKDTRDTTFILWVIVEGMAVGIGRYSTAVVGALAIATVLLYLRFTAFGARHQFDAVLNLHLAGDLATGLTTLREILARHAFKAELTNERRLSDEGLDLAYQLLLRDPSRRGELEWDLKQSQGVQRVSLFLRENESEV